jgi:hypothetical protein
MGWNYLASFLTISLKKERFFLPEGCQKRIKKRIFGDSGNAGKITEKKVLI